MIGHQLESLGSSVILLNETLLRKPITRKMRQFDYQTEQRRLTQTEGAACNQMNEFGKETLSSERSSFYRRGNNTVAMQNFNRSYFGRFTSNGHET